MNEITSYKRLILH